MLLGRSWAVRDRAFGIIALMVIVSVGVIALVRIGALAGMWEWPPRSSSPLGVWTGLIVGLIVFFEMLLAPRKSLRRFRLFSTKAWLRWHVWLGVLSLPLVLVHSGFQFGGPLPMVTMCLFLSVIASGVWGLILQQWLPAKLLRGVEHETVLATAPELLKNYSEEVRRLLVQLPKKRTLPDGVVEPAERLRKFGDDLVLPFLTRSTSRSPLRDRSQSEMLFSRLRDQLTTPLHATLDRMRDLVRLRQEWIDQARINAWLHGWLVVHVPLSLAMTILMVVHAVRAMKYW